MYGYVGTWVFQEKIINQKWMTVLVAIFIRWWLRLHIASFVVQVANTNRIVQQIREQLTEWISTNDDGEHNIFYRNNNKQIKKTEKKMENLYKERELYECTKLKYEKNNENWKTKATSHYRAKYSDIDDTREKKDIFSVQISNVS